MANDNGDDRNFSQPITLRNGTPVTIRVMRPDDRERIVAAFRKLDASTIYTRFFSYRKEIPASTLDRIEAIDFVQLAGLVATVGSGADETVIGSATYVAIPSVDGAKVAGLEDRVGSITPGKKADLVIIETKSPNVAPVIDPVAAVVLAADISNVDTVIVDGQIRKRGGKIVAPLDGPRQLVERSRDFLVSKVDPQPGWLPFGRA